MEHVIGTDKKLVITGKDEYDINKLRIWRDSMNACYGAFVWNEQDMMSLEYLYNPGLGIGGYASTILKILQKIVLYEMPYVIGLICDANTVQYAKTIHTMNLNGDITILNLTDWNSP